MSYWGAKNFPHLNLLTDKTPWRCQYVVSMESAIYEKKMIMIILLVTLCLHKARRKWEELPAGLTNNSDTLTICRALMMMIWEGLLFNIAI